MDHHTVAIRPSVEMPQASFLGLPPELRDLIYFFAYDRRGSWSRRQTDAHSVHDRKYSKDRRAQLHRVNHQLRKEALYRFYENTLIAFLAIPPRIQSDWFAEAYRNGEPQVSCTTYSA